MKHMAICMTSWLCKRKWIFDYIDIIQCGCPPLAFHLNCKAQLFGTLDIELTCGNFNLRSLGFRRIVTLDFRGATSWRRSPLRRIIAVRDNLAIDESFRVHRRSNTCIIKELINFERSSISVIYHSQVTRDRYFSFPCKSKVILLQRRLDNHVPYNLRSTSASVNERALTKSSRHVGLKRIREEKEVSLSFHYTTEKNNNCMMKYVSAIM